MKSSLDKYKRKKVHIPARIHEDVLNEARKMAKKNKVKLTDYIEEALIKMNESLWIK